MRAIRHIVRINEELCNGCGQCILDCAEGAIKIEHGKAKIRAEMLCDGLGACLNGCPTGALTIEQRQADPFNEEAVKKHLLTPLNPLYKQSRAKEGSMSLNCQSHQPQVFSKEKAPIHGETNTHWPLKLRLISAEAPALKNAHILIAADCSAFAATAFHNKLRQGKVVLIACPKFEDTNAIQQKITDILSLAQPKSFTVVRMEVPCCSGLPRIVHEAIKITATPVQDIILARDGSIVI